VEGAHRQDVLETVVRSLVASLVERSDRRSFVWKMLRDQALAVVDQDETRDAAQREHLRAGVEAFYRDVARNTGLPAG
jgi:hypothetical protein